MANEMLSDPQRVLERATRAYEWSRARRAAVLAAPLVGLVGLALGCGARLSTTQFVGPLLLVASWFFLWRGESLARAVLPGTIAGVIPLTCALVARSWGHVCTGTQCVSVCVPACTLGGAAAGFVIARAARNSRSRVRFVVGATILAGFVGSLGCSCVGFGGLGGLALGLAVTLLPASWALRRSVA